MCHFNPIELAWAELERKIGERNKSSFTFEEPQRLITKTIEEITLMGKLLHARGDY